MISIKRSKFDFGFDCENYQTYLIEAENPENKLCYQCPETAFKFVFSRVE